MKTDYSNDIKGHLPSLFNLSAVHAKAVQTLKSVDDPYYVQNCLVNDKKALIWSGYVKMDAQWIYQTSNSVIKSAIDDVPMIANSDEGDDCAYVIGNNARFRSFLLILNVYIEPCQ